MFWNHSNGIVLNQETLVNKSQTYFHKQHPGMSDRSMSMSVKYAFDGHCVNISLYYMLISINLP